PFTWSERPACLLHDLFVRPDIRGGGVGQALIQDLIDRGKTAGWDRIYWLTREDNATARRLYDTLAPADGFIRYKVLLP
ncbi:MAG TPA: GNAT family N-acetyltransferase, partial [Thermomicrobiales bacterium]|nr:GNAT family N-acetyltransferase [Thermomicrobiales bacterium]